MDNYKVYGMTCVVCASSVEKAVKALAGVSYCNVNLLMNTLQVDGDVPVEEVIKAVKDAGYKARLMNGTSEASSEEKMKADNSDDSKEKKIDADTESSLVSVMIKRLIISAILLLFLMYFTMGRRLFDYSLPGFLVANPYVLYAIQMILSLSVIAINSQYFVSGIKSIIHKAPNMDALISMGALAAFLYSAVVSVNNIIFYGNMGEYIGKSDIYFETSAMILVLVSIGKLIEEMAKGKTTDAIKDLTDMTPKTALILTGDGEKEVPIEDVKLGDIFILKPGMRVPVDGIVESGNSAVNEASLTGESVPVDKEIGSKVSAATINLSGYLTCKATEVGSDTTFSHIVQMVTDAASGKVNTAKTSDRVSGYLIFVVILLSIITFVAWMFTGLGLGFALSRAIAVLIISCPCAIGLATPVAVMVGNSIGAKHGILFKSAEAMENTGKTQIVVVDKTGTITTGEPKITDVVSTVKDIDHRDLLLKIAYSLESKSEHPLAKAICKYAQSRYIEPLDVINFEANAGKGIRGDIVLSGQRHTIYAGTESYIAQTLLGITAKEDEENFISDFSVVTDKLVEEGKTPVLFATKSGLLGVVAVADEINETSRDAVTALHKEDIHVVMVTGDRYLTAKAVGQEIGIAKEEVLSEVLPQDKADIIMKLKESGKVAMIGDGINDAPALTCADIGIAIGAGTDVAIDAADVVLIRNDLTSAVSAIRLSRHTSSIIRQNLFWALIYNIIGIPLAAGVFYKAFGWMLDPVVCALFMTISSILVVLNALRLFKFKIVDTGEIDDNLQGN